MEGRLSPFLIVRGLIDFIVAGIVVLYLTPPNGPFRTRWFFPGFDAFSLASLTAMGTLSLTVGSLTADHRMLRGGLLLSSVLSLLLGCLVVTSFVGWGSSVSSGPIAVEFVRAWWILMLAPGTVLIAAGACGFLLPESCDAGPAPIAATERTVR